MSIFSITGGKIYALSDVTGLRAWVDYVPVAAGGAGRAGSFDDEGYLSPTEALGDVTGLVAWRDYIPVYVVSGAVKWRYDDNGYLAVDPTFLGDVEPVFSPLDLFASGEPGAWYDPSDLELMFIDSLATNGAQPAVGDAVGYMADKKSRSRAPLTVVQSNDFVSDATGWVPQSANATISVVGGRLRVTAVAAGSFGAMRTDAFFNASAVYPNGPCYRITSSLYKNGLSAQFLVAANVGLGGRTNISPLNAVDIENFDVEFYQTTGRYFGVGATATQAGDYIEVGPVSIVVPDGVPMYQSSATLRPVLRQDGSGRYYLEFDGVDDRLGSANDAVQYTAQGFTQADSCVGYMTSQVATESGLLLLGSPAVQVGKWGVWANLANATTKVINRGGTLVTVNPTDTISVDTPYVIGHRGNISAPSYLGMRLNGALVGESTSSQGTGTFLNASHTLGTVINASFLAGRIYQAVFRIQNPITGDNLTNLEAYIADKTGVTLP